MPVITRVGSTVRVYLTTADSSPWTVPSDWSNTGSKVECIGGGGGGQGGGSVQGCGGGGGAYASNTNFAFTIGATISFQVGVGGAGGAAGNTTATHPGTNGTATWFSGTSLASCNVGAEGGYANQTFALGGTVANCVGTVKYAGGNGGICTNSQRLATGGGGAAGPKGTGAHGGDTSPNAGGGQVNASTGGGGNGGGGHSPIGIFSADDGGSTEGGVSVGGFPGGLGGKGTNLFANNSRKGLDGQNGNFGSGGGGGSAGGQDGSQIGAGKGGDGGNGDEWDTTHGSGGGGGGGGGSTVSTCISGNGGGGGLYGGGGGGGGTTDANSGIGVNGTGGAGANGLIVITYTSTNTTPSTNSTFSSLSKSDATWSVPTTPISNNGTANNLTFASYSVTSGDYIVVIAHKCSNSSTGADFVSGDCTQSSGTATIAGFTLDKQLRIRGGFDTNNYNVGIWSSKVTGTGTIVVRVGSASAADLWSGSVTPIRPSTSGTLAVLGSNTCQAGTQTVRLGKVLINSGIISTDKPSIVFASLTNGFGILPTAQGDWTSIFTTTSSVACSDGYRILQGSRNDINHTWAISTGADGPKAGIIVAYGIANTTPQYLSTVKL